MKTICYDLVSLHRKQLELNICPCCRAKLESREVAPAKASQVFAEQAAKPEIVTHYIGCPACAWWAIREQRLDHGLYHPPVQDLIVMEAGWRDAAQTVVKRNTETVIEQMLGNQACWLDAEVIPSRDAVELFGTVQMLMPGTGMPDKSVLMDKLKSAAPVLFPIVVILLFALFS